MDLSSVLGVIREFGFPTFVCLWLMWMYMRQESKVVAVLTSLRDVLQEVNKQIGGRMDSLEGAVEEIHDEISSAHPKPVLLPDPKEGHGK